MENEIIWSDYQKAIFKDVAEGKGSTTVQALAGSGKTYTLLNSVSHVPENKSKLLIAFNKKIVTELKNKCSVSDCQILTLHSLGLKAIYRTFPDATINQDKLFNTIGGLLGTGFYNLALRLQLGKAVNFAKFYLADTYQKIDNVLDEKEVDVEIDRGKFIDYVIKIMKLCRENTSSVDFPDMLYLPNVLNLAMSPFDYIFVDEAQDLNLAQINLILKSTDENSRVIAFGDKNQAIYSFAGADADSMDVLKKELKAKTLPLNITYRCPIKVVNRAKQFVPAFEAAPNAKIGAIEEIDEIKLLELAKPGCFILSRVNAPLIGLAMKFLKDKVPCNIQGKDIGANLITLIKSSRCKNIDKFIIWLDRWRKKEIARLTKQKKDTVAVEDRAGCLEALSFGVKDVDGLKKVIQDLFSDTDDYGKVMLGSIHSCKGLQRPTVFILKDTLKFFNQEEKNLNYVAITRTQDKLYFVS